MAKLFSGIVSVLALVGWVVYLAGIGSATNLCTKGAKGELTEPLVKEVGAFDKYVAIAQPFDLGLSKAAAAAAAASGTRKMLSFDTLVMPNHGRQLLGKEEQGCGWAYAFHWWTVALQGISVIGILLLAFTSSEGIAKLRPTFFAFLAINTALLCGIASQLIPVTFNLNNVKAKGKGVDAVYAASAGLIISLIMNFTWFISSSLEGEGSVQPVSK